MCALNKILNLVKEESVSGVSSGRAVAKVRLKKTFWSTNTHM